MIAVDILKWPNRVDSRVDIRSDVNRYIGIMIKNYDGHRRVKKI
jgi:hypothetical protein